MYVCYVSEQSYECYGSERSCMCYGSERACMSVRGLSGRVCVLGVPILPLFLRIFYWIFELFRQCGICLYFILVSQC